MGRKKKETKPTFTEEEIELMKSVKNTTEETIETLENQIKEYKDKNLRLMADIDNVRKNALKDKQSYVKYKNEALGKDLLAVIDDIERCIANSPKDTDNEQVKNIVDGITLIYNKFISVLNKNSISKMNINEGDLFNVDQHEAVSMIPAGEDMHQKVVAVTEPGYMIADKIMRYAKVVVGQ